MNPFAHMHICMAAVYIEGEGVIQIYVKMENYKIQILKGTAFTLKM
jgi:hypothetical protein